MSGGGVSAREIAFHREVHRISACNGMVQDAVPGRGWVRVLTTGYAYLYFLLAEGWRDGKPGVLIPWDRVLHGPLPKCWGGEDRYEPPITVSMLGDPAFRHRTGVPCRHERMRFGCYASQKYNPVNLFCSDCGVSLPPATETALHSGHVA